MKIMVGEFEVVEMGGMEGGGVGEGKVGSGENGGVVERVDGEEDVLGNVEEV